MITSRLRSNSHYRPADGGPETDLSDHELALLVKADRGRDIKLALSNAEMGITKTINAAVGRAGLGSNAFTSSYRPTEVAPVRVTEENRIAAARVQQTQEFDMLDRTVPKMLDQFTLALTEIGEKIDKETTETLDVNFARASVDANFANSDSDNGGVSDAQRYLDNANGPSK